MFRRRRHHDDEEPRRHHGHPANRYPPQYHGNTPYSLRRPPRPPAHPTPQPSTQPAAQGPPSPANITFHQPPGISNQDLSRADHSNSDQSSITGGEEAACIVCIRNARRRVRLECRHTYCRRCMRTLVQTAIRSGEGGWPPSCCQEINESVVYWLGDTGVVDAWRRRRDELEVAPRERVVSTLIYLGLSDGAWCTGVRKSV